MANSQLCLHRTIEKERERSQSWMVRVAGFLLSIVFSFRVIL